MQRYNDIEEKRIFLTKTKQIRETLGRIIIMKKEEHSRFLGRRVALMLDPASTHSLARSLTHAPTH